MFTYNASALEPKNGSNAFKFVNFDQTNNSAYSQGTVSFTPPGTATINVDYSSSTPDLGTGVPSMFTTIATLYFTVTDQAAMSMLDFVEGQTVVYNDAIPQVQQTQGTLSTSNTTLPVELASFNAAADGGAVVFNWSTASEQNNAGFTIEARNGSRSTWAPIQFVAGKGNSTELVRYSYRAESLPAGQYSFRLRQVDTDGATSYSGIVELGVGLDGQLTLGQPMPNPSRGATALSFVVPNSGVARLAVYDMMGREVARLVDGQVEGGQSLRADFSTEQLGAGVYVARLTSGQGTVSRTLTVVK